MTTYEVFEERIGGSLLHDYIAGAVAGGSGILIGHPFDTTKVQLQTQSVKSSYSGTWDAMKNIKSYGLIQGYFRGLSWPLLSYGVVNAVFFGVYGNCLKVLQRVRNEGDGPSNLDIYLSGCLAGAAQAVLACPVDLVKVILQSQIPHEVTASGIHKHGAAPHGKYYHGPLQCVAETFRRHGIRGCFKGMTAMLCRDVPSYGFYCSIYEYLTAKMHQHRWTDSRGVASMVAGGVAGTVTWFGVMPMDVIKSRLQADLAGRYTGILDCARKSLRSEGFRVFYRGTLITCLRAFPVNAVTFLVYSETLHYLN